MKKIVYIFLLITITSSIGISCKKQEQTEKKEKLPTGENTMYYYVDNKLVIPQDNYSDWFTPAISFGYCDSSHTTFTLNTLDLSFHFENGIQHSGIITFNQSNYDMCGTPGNHAFLYVKELQSDNIVHNIQYYTHEGSGTINITYLSSDKKHFKGTFQMDVYHQDTNEVKHITNGHFNINLNTLNR